MALEHQSSCGCGGGCDGGGKGALLSENRSLTLAANTNDQTVFQQTESITKNVMSSTGGQRVLYDITHNSEAYPNVEVSPTLNARMGTGGNQVPITMENSKESEINGALQSKASNNLNSNNVVRTQYAVRRLTPTECERLQGLPDDYTLIDDKSCSDSARYKALGNGMAQPCAGWIIQRIVEVTKEDEKC